MIRLLRRSCAALLFAASAAHAQQLPLWELGAFGGVATTPAYPGSSDRSTRGLALPFFIYRGDVFRVDQQGIGARLLRSDRVELDLGLAASLPARSRDVSARSGMPNLGTLLEVGPRLKVTLARPDAQSRIRFDLPLRAVVEARAGLRSQGWTFEPKLLYETHGEQEHWTFDTYLGMVFGDRKINRYFYEVQPAYATAERPAYAADSGQMLVRVGASGSRLLNPDLRVFAFVRYESYAGAANRASPLMQQRTGSSAGLAFSWTFQRSAQDAR
ncbi:MAG: MipA/OmpV family protein [Massilia sp.]